MLPLWAIIILFFVFACLELLGCNCFNIRDTIFCFKDNYETWTRLSWFSVILLTLIIFIVFFPMLALIVILKVLSMIFLREEDE